MHTMTFKPLSGGRYKCNQTGVIMTQKQILSYMNSILSQRGSAAINATPPRSKKNSSPKR